MHPQSHSTTRRTAVGVGLRVQNARGDDPIVIDESMPKQGQVRKFTLRSLVVHLDHLPKIKDREAALELTKTHWPLWLEPTFTPPQ